MIEIVKEKTCAVTGHRVVKKNFDKEVLRQTLIKIINDGYDTFLIGMAIGFDTLCFNVLLSLKEEYKLKIIACVPCLNQDKFFNKKQKTEYENIIRNSDDVRILSEEYSTNCMQNRNKFMVDNSNVLIAYLYKSVGGTYYTVKYAMEEGKEVIYLK